MTQNQAVLIYLLASALGGTAPQAEYIRAANIPELVAEAKRQTISALCFSALSAAGLYGTVAEAPAFSGAGGTGDVFGDEAAAKAAQAHTDWQGVVQFEDVSFRYPGADSDALEHISFTAKPGETTAIIGSTGCGKSTLLNLIPRFYDVTGGKVTVDGIDVREMPQAQLHDLLGYVPQKGVLFSGTIDSNLKFGGEDITDAQVHKAAAIAQATDFIEAKPEGYQSPIAQGGSNVSGGQKQRLSIARAIAKDPKVYLFDDSFSALDYKTDVTLRRALKAQTDNATVIIVAQRISTVLHANQILVLDEGRLVGKGTHAQLMVSCPEYQEIARSQLSQKELALDTLNTEKEGE